jgi:hypothetical protein
VLVLLALLILVVIARGAAASRARSKAERRRKFTALTGYGPNALDLDGPRPAEPGPVNPTVAAAGGAVAGAAVASTVGHGDHAPPRRPGNTTPSRRRSLPPPIPAGC